MRPRSAGTVLAAAVLAFGAGCTTSGDAAQPAAAPTAGSSSGGGESGVANGVGGQTGSTAGQGDTGKAGGLLRVLVAGAAPALDAQAVESGADALFVGRTVARTLTALRPDAAVGPPFYVADLATAAGEPDSSGLVWTFTLREGVTWDDGQPLTCQDFQRGIARAFLPGAPFAHNSVARSVLAVPADWRGPGDASGQAAFAKAVTCTGARLSLTLRSPEPELNALVASPEFAPAHASAGSSVQSAPRSLGPYRFDHALDSGGYVLSRNSHWRKETDPVRQANPDEVEVVAGLSDTAVLQRLLNDEGDDAKAVSWARGTPALLNQIQGFPAIRSRVTTPWSGAVEYLAPNLRSPVMKNVAVRRAFALATDSQAYVAALGGASVGSATGTLVGPTVSGRSPSGVPAGASDRAAQALAALRAAGVTVPVPVRLAVPDVEATTKAFATVRATWRAAGFEVTIVPLPVEGYLDRVATATAAGSLDVVRMVWTPDHPSASAVLQPLFDSSLTAGGTSSGPNVGWFADASVNVAMAKAHLLPLGDERDAAWAEIDRQLLAQAAYVPLVARRAIHLHGSKVAGAQENPIAGTVDLAVVSVS